MYQLQLFDFGKESVLGVFDKKPSIDELSIALGDFANHANRLLERGQSVVEAGVVYLKLINNEDKLCQKV